MSFIKEMSISHDVQIEESILSQKMFCNEYKNDSEESTSNYEIEIDVLEDPSDEEIAVVEEAPLTIENLTPIENYLSTTDLKSKLRRWAVNSEISIPKLNSLLRILKDYHKSVPNDANSLLGSDIYKKQKMSSQKVVNHKQLNSEEIHKNENLTEIAIHENIGNVIEDLKNNIDKKIDEVQNLLQLSLENSTTSDQKEVETNLTNYQNIDFPLTSTEQLDFIHKSINDLEFRNKLINELKFLKGDCGFDIAFKKTMSDDFLSNYVLKNYAKRKGFVNFDFYTKILFEAWRDPHMGIKEFTILFSKSFKRSIDRKYLKSKKQSKTR